MLAQIPWSPFAVTIVDRGKMETDRVGRKSVRYMMMKGEL
jgi:hypothetical protein